MSKKIKFFAGAVVVAALAFGVTLQANAAFAYTGVLKQGARSASVMSLQQTLNMTSCKVAVSGAGSPGMETTYFGTATKAAVQCFQAANGLTADGVVGPMTGAALAAVNGSVVVPGLPAGCTSTAGFSTTTGQSCSSTSSYPAGCTSSIGFSPTTGAKCDGSTSGSTGGALTGGAGTLDFSSTSTDVEDSIKEDASDVAVLGFKAEADGSDIATTNLKVVFQNQNNNSSERLNRYVDEVSVWLGDTKVGSASVSKFSRSSVSGENDEYSATIPLSGAVVKDGNKATFYVKVDAVSNIDSDDMDASWEVTASTIRYTDATGAILSDTVNEDETFTVEDASADDDIAIKSSSQDPASQSIIVEENKKSDKYLVGVFKLDVDEDSSDITLDQLPVVFHVSDGGTALDDADALFSSVEVKVDGDSFDAELVSPDSITDGSGTATYVVDFDDDGFTIDSGDTVDVEIYATFTKQDGNYDSGTTIYAAVDGDDIDAESENGDTVDVSGSYTGDEQTLVVSGAAATYSSESFIAENPGDSIDGTISIVMDVTAVGDDLVLAANGSNISSTLSGGTKTGTAVTVSGVSANGGNYTISEGSTKKVTLSVKFDNSSGFVKLVVNSIDGTPVANIETASH